MFKYVSGNQTAVDGTFCKALASWCLSWQKSRFIRITKRLEPIWNPRHCRRVSNSASKSSSSSAAAQVLCWHGPIFHRMRRRSPGLPFSFGVWCSFGIDLGRGCSTFGASSCKAAVQKPCSWRDFCRIKRTKALVVEPLIAWDQWSEQKHYWRLGPRRTIDPGAKKAPGIKSKLSKVSQRQEGFYWFWVDFLRVPKLCLCDIGVPQASPTFLVFSGEAYDLQRFVFRPNMYSTISWKEDKLGKDQTQQWFDSAIHSSKRSMFLITTTNKSAKISENERDLVS